MADCKLCARPDRAEIDKTLVEGLVSNRTLATNCGVSEAAVRRHRKNHIPVLLAKAEEAKEVARADDLLSQVQSLQVRTLSILNTAETQADLRTALAAIREARGNLELLGKLAGQLHDQEVKVAVLVQSPDWVALRAAILLALDPYPDARLAVVGALNRVS